MLNPELIKRYGVSTKKLFDSLVSELGVQLASTCYIPSISCVDSIGNVMMPDNIVSTSDKKHEIRCGINSFVSKNAYDSDDYWMMLLAKKPDDGDIKLWV